MLFPKCSQGEPEHSWPDNPGDSGSDNQTGSIGPSSPICRDGFPPADSNENVPDESFCCIVFHHISHIRADTAAVRPRPDKMSECIPCPHHCVLTMPAGTPEVF